MKKSLISTLFLVLSIFSSIYSQETTVQYDTIVVGAGVAGLSAGLELSKNNKTFLILEANQEVFGRVKTLFGFADFPIEIGAEFVHGNNNPFYSLVKEFINSSNYSFVSNKFNEAYWLESEKRLLSWDEVHREPGFMKDLRVVLRYDDMIGNYRETQDMVVDEYVNIYLEGNEFRYMFSTLSSHDQGASSNEAGILGLQEDEDNWGLPSDRHYREFLLKKGNFHEIFSTHFKSIIPKVKLNSVVKQINYEKDYVEVTLENGDKFRSKNVIVTVSLGVLKKGLITFTPALPKEKVKAINGLGFGGGIKVLIKLNRTYWPDPQETLFIYSNSNETEGVIPIYWVANYGGRSQKDIVLTGFLTGSRARSFEHNPNELLERVKSQLSNLFKVTRAELQANILDTYVQNWGENPYILGGYSYIGLNNAYQGLRKKLAKNIANKVFFAGEATSVNFCSTVQGGLVTGEQAAKLASATK